MTIETKIRSEASSCEPVFAMFLQKVAILDKVVDSDGLGLKKPAGMWPFHLKWGVNHTTYHCQYNQFSQVHPVFAEFLQK